MKSFQSLISVVALLLASTAAHAIDCGSAGDRLSRALAAVSGARKTPENFSRPDVPYHQVLATIAQPEGVLQLVRVNSKDPNARPYNLRDVQLLIRNNPELAGALGFLPVPGSKDLIWIPDEAALNAKFKALVRSRGFEDPIYSMGWNPVGYPGQGSEILSAADYLKLLANGKHPMGRSVIGAIHDGMHAAAFVALASTPHGRQVLRAAKSRAAALLAIRNRFDRELSGKTRLRVLWLYDQKLAELINSPFERTMAISHLLTGNEAYAFPSMEGPGFEARPIAAIKADIEKTLGVLETGDPDPSDTGSRPDAGLTQEVLDDLIRKSGGDTATTEKIRRILSEEIGRIAHTTPEVRASAADEMIEVFFPKGLVK